ncbi:MAG: hypothetical protein ACHQFZ_05465 [Acidimicrobiales bacterium]
MTRGLDESPSRARSWLEQPLPAITCVIGWLAASATFLALVSFLGGPIEGDAAESVYSTWAVAHGAFACAYPPSGSYGFPSIAHPYVLIAPLYPVLSGLLSAVLRVGHVVPFPTVAHLGSHCSTAFAAILQWSVKASAIQPTINLSYVTWPILMAGAVYLLRATNRGRTRWEFAGLMALAVTPPVFMCILDSFHPQDILAMGLVLGGLGGALRSRWILAGVLLGLAVTAQQFSLLAVVPLVVVMNRQDRWPFAWSFSAAWAAISVPVVLWTSGRALSTALFGSSRISLMGTRSVNSAGGTVLFGLGLHGLGLFIVSRLAPLLAAALLAYWAARQLGPNAMRPVPLLSLVGSSLCLRLIFEENLFGYYFMAVAVTLLTLDVMRGRIRAEVVAWIGLVTLAFNPIPWGFYSNWTTYGYDLVRALPFAGVAVVAGVMLVDLSRRRFRWFLGAWVVLVVLTCFPQLWGRGVGVHVVPTWFWQVTLVPVAFYLALRPLLDAVGSTSHDVAPGEPSPATI